MQVKELRRATGQTSLITIQRDLMIATEIIALSHREEYDPFQAITASTMIGVVGMSGI